MLSDIKYVGFGSAFSVNEFNNCHYLENDNHIVFLDFGADIFKRVLRLNLLNPEQEVTVVLSHMHNDHVGGLSDLILYVYFAYGKKVNVVIQKELRRDLTKFLSITLRTDVAKPSELYDLTIADRFIIAGYSFRALKSHHVTGMESFSYVITNSKTHISYFYSADSTKIPKEILQDFLTHKITLLYQDVSNYETGPHLYINELAKLIPIESRDRVCCMHIDGIELEHKIMNFGFNTSYNACYEENQAMDRMMNELAYALYSEVLTEEARLKAMDYFVKNIYNSSENKISLISKQTDRDVKSTLIDKVYPATGFDEKFLGVVGSIYGRTDIDFIRANYDEIFPRVLDVISGIESFQKILDDVGLMLVPKGGKGDERGEGNNRR